MSVIAPAAQKTPIDPLHSALAQMTTPRFVPPKLAWTHHTALGAVGAVPTLLGGGVAVSQLLVRRQTDSREARLHAEAGLVLAAAKEREGVAKKTPHLSKLVQEFSLAHTADDVALGMARREVTYRLVAIGLEMAAAVALVLPFALSMAGCVSAAAVALSLAAYLVPGLFALGGLWSGLYYAHRAWRFRERPHQTGLAPRGDEQRADALLQIELGLVRQCRHDLYQSAVRGAFTLGMAPVCGVGIPALFASGLTAPLLLAGVIGVTLLNTVFASRFATPEQALTRAWATAPLGAQEALAYVRRLHAERMLLKRQRWQLNLLIGDWPAFWASALDRLPRVPIVGSLGQAYLNKQLFHHARGARAICHATLLFRLEAQETYFDAWLPARLVESQRALQEFESGAAETKQLREEGELAVEQLLRQNSAALAAAKVTLRRTQTLRARFQNGRALWHQTARDAVALEFPALASWAESCAEKEAEQSFRGCLATLFASGAEARNHQARRSLEWRRKILHLT